MEPFLLQVAQRMLGEHGTQLHQVAVVLPSARAGLHLRKHLATVAGSALWSPDMLTWDSFIERVSGARRMGDLETLFELFAAYRSTRADPENLDAFLAWAPTVLADIDDAETNLVELDRFYGDLRALEGIEHWSLGEERFSSGQQRLVNYWQQQGALHRAFVDRVSGSSAGTAGMLARAAAGQVRNGAVLPWTTVWFAGLNAFTAAQQSIVDALVRKRTARLCWDADRAYLDHPVHEAGHFLRKAIARSGEGLIPIGNDLRTNDRCVHVSELPTSTAQALHAASLLAALTMEERARTAVVLADEALLQPLLDALPADIGPVNVTMGLRLHDLPVNALIGTFLELHRSYDPITGYPVREVERLFRHPFLGAAVGVGGNKAMLGIAGSVPGTSISYQALKSASPQDNDPCALLLSALEPINGDASCIALRLNALLSAAAMSTGHRPLEREQLHRMARMHHELQAQLVRTGTAYDLHAYERLHARLVRQQRIAFFGEPLQGLQVMGMLETRAIDHERIIVLSCNEGKLPPASGDRSFIPFDVRHVHGLPLAKDSDALAAYTFHRLLQRAGHVHLLFAADSGEAAAGPSRYIAQLENDAIGTPTVIDHTALHAPLAVRSHAPIAVAKDTAVLERLRAVLAKGISPSAFGCFLRCPLDFHFRYIMHLKEPDNVEDELASNVLGTAVHEALQRACTPLIGKLLRPEDLHHAAGLVGDLLRECILAQRPDALLDEGHARLQWHMASEAMRRALKMDADALAAGTEMEFIAFEQELAVELPTMCDTLGIPVRIRGRIDRIDRRDGVYRIMDVKTGSVRAEHLKLRSWDAMDLDADKEKALQLACYAFLFLNNEEHIGAVQAGIIPLQKPSRSDKCVLSLGDDDLVHRSTLPAIEGLLVALLSRMLDPGVPFVHDPGSEHCAFCIGSH